jgi:hypothetical protein
MPLIRFRDNTYGRPYVVSAEDLLSAIQRDKRVVALRHRNGVKFGDDGYSQRRGDSCCILLSYIPLSSRDEAKAILERENVPKMLNEGLSSPHSALSLAARKGGRP